ncbi:hypothetical protein UFOVP530_34 [uncultured Caudovirales phage]|uniref:Uncharacterized protein n=1 Tax=uncultured Caudovirales phage TaxID=2100421 RepID=A0A6J5R1R0_9CAUD|nr:hypothetical protein UFOVP530_34 [uncultured Caudovirales phage]CAB4179076.1 hypothetical protein UFOVP1027_34 [uncultured Caudovirales phage]CAB4188636.1 hypothetical protein UFOVP1182_52 [uncultured Caudovirales phage]CAB4220431.1 hypothetical protein UFOVP1632_16 [uncultured Caudovirales phage]
MIKNLSPYYITIPFVSPTSGLTCTAYTLQVFIWDGLKTSVPAEPIYEIRKQNATASIGNDRINIARLISSFINLTAQTMTVTDLYDANNQLWVRTQVRYETSNPTDFLPKLTTTSLTLKGYAYGMEGENTTTPANNILMQGTEFKVSRNGFFNIPIFVGEPVYAPVEFLITDIVVDEAPLYTLTYTRDGLYDDLQYRYRLQPSTDWIVGDDLFTYDDFPTIPITLPLVAGDYDVQIYAYDVINNVLAYSNIYELTIV